MKLSELEKRRAYKEAFRLLNRMGTLLRRARSAHEKDHAQKNLEQPKKAA
jgi:hypothetical protein